ncbi:MAG: hypothetical protein Q4E17_02070, partial [Synergistes sp.]|nr:hypothetical protein [Synergistes sp.]
TPKGGIIDLTNGVYENYGAPIVTYTAAAIKDGKANCVSAILVSGDKYVNYAKISDQASETAKKIPFGDLADGRYRMFIFAEEANGDKQTDYASKFSNDNGYEFIKGIGTVYTSNLSKAHKDKDITINLGGGFDLGFENAEYVTKITVVDNDSDNKLTGDKEGTTIAGKVIIEKGAQVTCCGKTTFKNLEVNGKLTVENGAVVELQGIQIVGEGAIFMNENATIVNNSGQDIIVWDISGDEPKEVTVKAGESYNPSQETPSKGGGSSVGCNAGFGIAMLLSAAAAMLRKRKLG